MVSKEIPSVSAVKRASSIECCEEWRLGIANPRTFSGPTAAAATHAATAESMPPESPKTMDEIPDLRQ